MTDPMTRPGDVEPLCGCAAAEIIDHYASEHRTGVRAATPILPDATGAILGPNTRDGTTQWPARAAHSPVQPVVGGEKLRAAAAEVAAFHRQGDWTEEGWRDGPDGAECSDCSEPWPCSAENLRRFLAATPEDQS